MQPRETLHIATIVFHNEISKITGALVTTAPWYKRLFMDNLELKWLDNRRSVSVNLYQAAMKLCDVAIENDYAVDTYSVYVSDTIEQLIKNQSIGFYCDEHLEVWHRAFLRSYEKYQKVVKDFKNSRVSPIY